LEAHGKLRQGQHHDEAAFLKLDGPNPLHKIIEVIMETPKIPPSDAPVLKPNVRLYNYRLLCFPY
jgi:hypothetical protein